jgi:hypothetical protein
MTQVDICAPLWKAYQATKEALLALEAVPPLTDITDKRYVQRQRRRFAKVVTEFEERFPGYRQQDYLESQIGLK